jgi:hypothetical protein
MWDEWERRNPGVAHPDRAKDREKRGRRLRLEDWAQGTERFEVPPQTLAEKTRASRGWGQGRVRRHETPKPW